MADPNEIEVWFHAYKDDVFNFLVYLCGRRDVEDLVQETFIHALKSNARFAGKSSAKTWLISIARNVAIDTARKQQRYGRNLKEAVPPQAALSPERALEMSEAQSELLQAIQSLRPNYRDVIILRGIMELSTQEAANTLQWPSARVRVTFFRALKALRMHLTSGDCERGGYHEWA